MLGCTVEQFSNSTSFSTSAENVVGSDVRTYSMVSNVHQYGHARVLYDCAKEVEECEEKSTPVHHHHNNDHRKDNSRDSFHSKNDNSNSDNNDINNDDNNDIDNDNGGKSNRNDNYEINRYGGSKSNRHNSHFHEKKKRKIDCDDDHNKIDVKNNNDSSNIAINYMNKVDDYSDLKISNNSDEYTIHSKNKGHDIGQKKGQIIGQKKILSLTSTLWGVAFSVLNKTVNSENV